ncbi:MAG: class II SORL domain-containing protein [Nitrospirae bacterium]|nr:class II SORL domain-containing protein [Nitrospirota bacterium]
MAGKHLFSGFDQSETIVKRWDLERRHMPVIECPDIVISGEPFQVRVRIGEIHHPMDHDHHVQWIDVYCGDDFCSRIDLAPEITRPEVVFTMAQTAKNEAFTLRAIHSCNIHGQWESMKEVVVNSVAADPFVGDEISDQFPEDDFEESVPDEGKGGFEGWVMYVAA